MVAVAEVVVCRHGLFILVVLIVRGLNVEDSEMYRI
jgi:hypothetical protein